MSPPSLLLIQFAKYPQLGKVKTRLAATLGDEHALAAHISLTRAVYAHLLAVPFAQLELHLDCSPVSSGAPETAQLKATAHFSYLSEQTPVRLQAGHDLGQKMANAILQGLRSYEQVVIVGSDCPTVDIDYVKQVHLELIHQDLVFIPSDDGGFVCVGARRFVPEVFTDVAWGGAGVLQACLANAQTHDLSCSCLAETWDVDTIKDYERWLKYDNKSSD